MPGKATLKRIAVAGIAMLAVAALAAAQAPQISGIENAAPFMITTGNVARGELISIYGSNLANGVTSAFAPPSPTLSLAGASVTIGGLPAPVTYASPIQLDVQVPFEIPAGVPSVNVTVTVGNLTSAPFLMSVVTSDLGMFYTQAGGTIFSPSEARTAIVQTVPAAPLVIMAFGLGSISPAVPSGTVPSSGASSASATPIVMMNGISARVLSATYVGLGLYAIAVDVPAGVSSGSVTVVLGDGNGATGLTGAAGLNGAAGPMGPSGPAGPAGLQQLA